MNKVDFLSGLITGFTVGVILMALIFVLGACTSTTESPYVGPTPEAMDNSYELVGCTDHVCTYTFAYKKGALVHRCFLSVGSYPGFGDSWSFDLECP